MPNAYLRELSFALLDANGAAEAATFHINDELPGEVRKCLRSMHALRAAIGPKVDDRAAAALRVVGSAMWDAWRATGHLEGHADVRLLQARDELEAAARLALGGVRRAAKAKAAAPEPPQLPGRTPEIRQRRMSIVMSARDGLTRQQVATALGISLSTLYNEERALAAAGIDVDFIDMRKTRHV